MNLKITSSFLFILTLLITFGVVHPNLDRSNSSTSTKLTYISPDKLSENIVYIENNYHPIEIPSAKSLKASKQSSLLIMTINQLEQQSVAENNNLKQNLNLLNEFAYIEKSRFNIANSKTKKANVDIEQMHIVLPENESFEVNISEATLAKGSHQLKDQKPLNNSAELAQIKQSKFNLTHSELTTSIDIEMRHVVLPEYDYEINKNLIPLQQDLDQLKDQNISKSNSNRKISNKTLINKNIKKSLGVDHIGYWQTVYSIESKQGKLLFRPKNKSRNCNQTSGPCGHHQLTVQALKDIGCNSMQCRKDRLNYDKSLKLSKKLLVLNEKRLRKNGITKLTGYKKYLIHQQGANGIKNIIAATQGKKVLSKKIKKNMANNSPYSYRQLKKMGSKAAAKRFMQHWENKWVSEKRLIVASQTTATKSTDNLISADFIPTFNDNELNLALNMRF